MSNIILSHQDHHSDKKYHLNDLSDQKYRPVAPPLSLLPPFVFALPIHPIGGKGKDFYFSSSSLSSTMTLRHFYFDRFFVVKIKRTFKSPHSLEYFFPFDVILHLHISILAHIFPHGKQLFKQLIPQKSYSPYSVYRNYIKL